MEIIAQSKATANPFYLHLGYVSASSGGAQTSMAGFGLVMFGLFLAASIAAGCFKSHTSAKKRRRLGYWAVALLAILDIAIGCLLVFLGRFDELFAALSG